MAFEDPTKAEPFKAPTAPTAPTEPVIPLPPEAPSPPMADLSPDASLADAHGRLLRDGTTQFAFADPPPSREPRAWEWPPWLAEFFDAITPFAPWVFWGLLALFAGLLLYQFIESLAPVRLAQGSAAAPEPPPPAFRPTPTRARALLQEADSLAAAGQFAAAARILLHRSIDDMEDHRGLPVRPGMTSRELAHWHRLDDAGRRVFARIAETVERAFFAGERIDAEDYRACREAYERFALSGAQP